jgi:hypothetical protein
VRTRRINVRRFLAPEGPEKVAGGRAERNHRITIEGNRAPRQGREKRFHHHSQSREAMACLQSCEHMDVVAGSPDGVGETFHPAKGAAKVFVDARPGIRKIWAWHGHPAHAFGGGHERSVNEVLC